MSRPPLRILWSTCFAVVTVDVMLTACASGDANQGEASLASTGGAASVASGGSSGTNSNASGGATGKGGAGITIDIPKTAQDAGIADAAAATGDANCGSTTSKLEKQPADLLLVLDRSTSMTQAMDSTSNCAADATNCAQRMATMKASLKAVLEASPDEVHWGLKLFSTPTNTTTPRGGTTSSCNVSAGVEVAIAQDTSDSIQTEITQAGTASSTPTRQAVDAAVAYLKTLDDGNPKYILLATDGEPNCNASGGGTGTSDLAGAVTAVEAAVAAGYKVFVIGVGPETANLTSLAQAGGTDHFYSATTPDDLANALASIVGTVAPGCSYQIGQTPPANPNAIGVYLDKSLIPHNANDGWSYDSANATILINGSYCDDLKSGKKTQVDIFLPCAPDVPLPPTLI